jgi:uncharacterized membrane protein YkvA (DUF1232 family)
VDAKPLSHDEFGEQEEFVKANFPQKVSSLRSSMRVVKDALALYRYMIDPEIHWVKKTMIAGALAYFIMPADIVPDIAPLVGYLDDAGVLTMAIRYLGFQIEKYY